MKVFFERAQTYLIWLFMFLFVDSLLSMRLAPLHFRIQNINGKIESVCEYLNYMNFWFLRITLNSYHIKCVSSRYYLHIKTIHQSRCSGKICFALNEVAQYLLIKKKWTKQTKIESRWKNFKRMFPWKKPIRCCC